MIDLFLTSETNLKVRQPLMETFDSIKNNQDLVNFKGLFLLLLFIDTVFRLCAIRIYEKKKGKLNVLFYHTVEILWTQLKKVVN